MSSQPTNTNYAFPMGPGGGRTKYQEPVEAVTLRKGLRCVYLGEKPKAYSQTAFFSRSWRHRTDQATDRGRRFTEDPLYASRIGKPCVIVAIGKGRAYNIIIQWDDGFTGVTKAEFLRPVPEQA